MSSFPFSKSPLVVLSLLIVAVFALRSFIDAFTNVEFLKTRSVLSGGETQITMLTYNIWFSPKDRQKRMQVLAEIVQGLKPDILTFQEVTPKTLAILREQNWFPSYTLSPPEGKSTESYFVVILSSYRVYNWNIHPFKNSDHGRQLLTAVVNYKRNSTLKLAKRTRFVIATSHLESLAHSTRKREQQLKESIRVLSDYNNVCLMGDMNIESEIDGEVVLPSPWIDAWLTFSKGVEADGNTWDPRNNLNVNEPGRKERVDRVFCKLSDFKVKSMKVVGKKPKSGVLPSDHYGLFTVLERTKRRNHNVKHQENTEAYFKRPVGWEQLI